MLSPLSSRSINAQSPFHSSSRTPASVRGNGTRTARSGGYYDENCTPMNHHTHPHPHPRPHPHPHSYSSSKPAVSRLPSQTKSSVTRLSSTTSSPSSPNNTFSRLPRRADTPNSAKSLIPKANRSNRMAAIGTGVSSTRSPPPNGCGRPSPSPSTITIHPRDQIGTLPASRNSKPLPAEKPLPSRPVATLVNELSPSQQSRVIIDAAEKPLRLSTGKSDEAHWPSLSPVRVSPLQPASPRDINPPPFSPCNPYSYFPQRNLRSHWSIDTPETPASIMSPMHLFDDDDHPTSPVPNSPAAAADMSPSAHASPTMVQREHPSRSSSLANLPPYVPQSELHGPLDIKERKHRPRSISLTDRTSNGADTLSTMDTTELTHNSNERVQASDRPHSPPPYSFCQSRVADRRSSLPDTPTPQNSLQRQSQHHVTASRIPIYDPRKTPNIIDIKPRITPTPTPQRGTSATLPTFGGRRLDSPADFAALDKDHQSHRKPPRPTVQTHNLSSYNLAKKVSLANIKGQQAQMIHSSNDSQRSRPIARRGSSVSTRTSERSDSRVRQISGQLLSSTFPGSTLTIYDDADVVLLGRSGQGRMTNQDAAFHEHPPDPTTAQQPHRPAMDVELTLTVDDHHEGGPVAQRTLRANMSDLMSAELAQDGHLPGAAISAYDQEADQNITATLSLLEGTPPAGSPSHDDFIAFANAYGKKISQRVQPPDFHHVQKQERESISSGAMTPEMIHDAVSPAPQQHEPIMEVCKPNKGRRSPVRRPAEHAPSYMSPTPASQARRVSKSQSKTEKSIGFPSRIPSKAPKHNGAGETVYSPKTAIGKLSPSNISRKTSCSPGHTPSNHLTNNVAKASVEDDGASVAVEAPDISQMTSSEQGYKSKHRPRSDSKSRFMSNFKGLFTSKRDAIPPVPSIDGKLNRHTQKGVKKGPLSAHGNPTHGKSAITITTPDSVPSDHSMLPKADSQAHIRNEDNHAGSLSHSTTLVSLCNGEDTLTTLVGVTHILMSEAEHSEDPAKRERLLSLAKVMLDTVSHSKEAERSMLTAQQAADSARSNYEMCQRSVLEMGRLVSGPGGKGVSGVLKKIAAGVSH